MAFRPKENQVGPPPSLPNPKWWRQNRGVPHLQISFRSCRGVLRKCVAAAERRRLAVSGTDSVCLLYPGMMSIALGSELSKS